MTTQQLYDNIRKKKSFLCVGLDTDLKKVPPFLLQRAHEDPSFDPIFQFNRAIIDATAHYCIAYKPNLAFYEAHGVKGWIAFQRTVRYIRQHYPDQFIIADAKRGDIGNTSKLYARTFFEHIDVDALTVAPYMGEDSVTPFLAYPGKYVILLALTSNKGSADFQQCQILNTSQAQQLSNRKSSNCQITEPLFQHVIRTSQQWEKKASPLPTGEGSGVGLGGGLMYVVGATHPSALAHIRRLAPNHFLLVPGIGAQGGSLQQVCKYGWNNQCGLIVNSSRAIIYADPTEQFAQAAAEQARQVQQQMAAILNEH